MPSGATGVVTDANGDVTSMTIPGEGTWTVDPTTGAITFTPQVGFTGNPTVQQYNIEDNAGVVSNNANLTITYLAPITISGTVFNDANGNTVINAGENGTTAGTNLYVYLVNGSGIVVDSAKVLPNGTYTMDAGQNTSYTIELSTIQYTIGTNVNTTPIINTAPVGWVTTGENGAGNIGSGDGTPNGVLAVTTATTNVTQQNFGIEQPPIAENQSYVINMPVFNSVLVLNGTGAIASPAPLVGSDPEDGVKGVGDIFTITSIAGLNGNSLFYNGVQITGVTTISNYNPNLLQVQFSGIGTTSLSFQYTTTDAAGVVSNIATYTIIWVEGGPLPVKLTSFSANIQNSTVLVDWKVATESNVKYYQVVYSNNGISFETIGTIIATNSSQYSFTHNNPILGNNYYRLSWLNESGEIQYSQVSMVRVDRTGAVIVYPNPIKSTMNINFSGNWLNKPVKVELFNQIGQLLVQKEIKTVQSIERLDVNNLPSGTYLLKLKQSDNTIDLKQVIISK